MNLTLADVCAKNRLFFECVSGSKAYGTDTLESDTDLRGIFVAPRKMLYGLGHVDQVSDEKGDRTYYELGRFIELLAKNNPNIVEMLFTDEECLRFQHPLFELIDPALFLSRLCESTFAGYAMTQVRKARGLKKKIVNPMDEIRKSPLDFCYVLEGQGSVPLRDWLSSKRYAMERCGLVNVPHMPDVFGLYYDASGDLGYRGIFKDEDATEVRFTSVAKEVRPEGWMSYNRDAFKKYCREYREYREWIENRNEARYQTNVDHGRDYDSKNMMHTFRLLDMAAEIAEHARITVRRPNRDFLMKIRCGEFTYNELIEMAESRIGEIGDLYARSNLPDEPDHGAINDVLVRIREEFYAAS